MLYKFDKFSYISSLLAFLIWSIWTYIINIEGDNTFLSSIVQGIYSAIITLFMVYLIKFFYNILPKKKRYFVLPSVFTVIITTSFITLIHIFINTHNIIYTILPTIFVAFIFSLYTTQKLKKKEQNV